MKSINNLNEVNLEKLDQLVEEELEERIELGCWATECQNCNDKAK